MNPFNALKHYKTRAAMARAASIGDEVISRTAVAKWFKKGVIPELRARRLAFESGGKLKFNPKLYG